MKILKKSFSKIIKLPNIHLINPSHNLNKQGQVLKFMAKYQLRARDAYHLFIMKENEIKYLATFDNDFEQVFKTRIVTQFIPGHP